MTRALELGELANFTSVNVAGNTVTFDTSLTNDATTVGGNTALTLRTHTDNKAANAYANVFNGGTFTGVVTMQANLTANTVRLNGSMQIDGDLIVSGNTVTMNVSSLAVEDNMIYLNSSSNVANPDIGIAGNYNDGTYRHTGVFRDATDGVWKFFHQYEPEPDASAYIDTSNNTFALANVQANTFIGALSGSLSGNVVGNTANLTTSVTVGSNALTVGTTLYVVANGNVGINTSSPTAPLYVGSNTAYSANASILLRDTAGNTTNYTFCGLGFTSAPDTDWIIGKYNNQGKSSFQIRDQSSLARFHIDANTGHVGLGNNTPQVRLHLYGPYNEILRLEASNTSYDAALRFFQNNSQVGNIQAGVGVPGTGLYFSTSNSTQSVVFAPNNLSNTFQIHANGMIFINTSSDTNYSDTSTTIKLIVNGDQHFSRQSAKIYFGDVTNAVPLSIGEGLQGDSGTDKDFLSLYGRSNIRFYTYTIGSGATSTEYMRISPNSVAMLGEPYSTYVKSVATSDGGTQSCRFIEDCLGRWILVGRFAADASVNIGGTWSSVRGLSTSTSQSQTTEFSADWGSSYPTEVRVMGSTDFDFWKPNRTIDFIYRVPSGRNWATFFNSGSTTMDQTATRFGFAVAGAYDGFGRWNNPSMNWMGMSDTATTNPSSAYTTPTSSAFNWNTANDAKLTAIHTGTYSGQDFTETVGFGYDDNIRGFSDAYPSTQSNMGGGTAYSSAVWILIKLN